MPAGRNPARPPGADETGGGQNPVRRDPGNPGESEPRGVRSRADLIRPTSPGSDTSMSTRALRLPPHDLRGRRAPPGTPGGWVRFPPQRFARQSRGVQERTG